MDSINNVFGEWISRQPLVVDDNDAFPPWLRTALLDEHKFDDPGLIEKIKTFLVRRSEVCASIVEEHGTFRITRIAYTGRNVMGQKVHGIDRWLWVHGSAQALRDRLESASQMLADFLAPYLGKGKKAYHVRDLGGADAPYFFRTAEILKERGIDFSNLLWEVVDQNELACQLGKSNAVDLGLEDRVRFVQMSFMKPESLPSSFEDQADLVLAIGIVCSLPPTVAAKFLDVAKRHAKIGSRLFVPTLSERSFLDDSESYLIYRIIGWHLWPKDEALVRQVFDVAQLRVDSITSERDNGHYHFVWATVI